MNMCFLFSLGSVLTHEILVSHCCYMFNFLRNCKNAFQSGYVILFSQFSSSVASDSLQPHGLHHTRPPCPSPTPRVYPNSCPSSRWCHPTISPSVIPFSSCLQSFPASGSFPMSPLYASGSQRIGVSTAASVLPINTQDWSPLGWTGWISLQSKTTIQKHEFFSAQLSL